MRVRDNTKPRRHRKPGLHHQAQAQPLAAYAFAVTRSDLIEGAQVAHESVEKET
jgi:hypothetical protein